MVKRSLTNSIVIRKKNNTNDKKEKKSPMSAKFGNYLNKDKDEKEEKPAIINMLLKGGDKKSPEIGKEATRVLD